MLKKLFFCLILAVMSAVSCSLYDDTLIWEKLEDHEQRLSEGVFRSEPTSCMHNNIPYYNAISREAMVKRIMKYAGEEYSFEAFKALDKESLPQEQTKSQWLLSDDTFVSVSSPMDQRPPKFMGERPSFNKNAF